MTRVLLSRLPGDRVAAAGPGGARAELAAADLPAYVAAREAEAAPTWVWDDTVRWYPDLLAAGVRVRRCTDLRLVHHLLRSAPAADNAHLAGEQSEWWDALGPGERALPGLFAVEETAESVRVDLEDARQLAALAASPEASRLRLLVAAESAGALVAAEMTHAGLPWRQAVHEEMLTRELGAKPPRGARPVALEVLAAQLGELLGVPRLNPDSRPELIGALRRAGLEVPDTRAWTLRRLDHPVVEPLLRYKKLAQLFWSNGWAWSEEWAHGGRFRPAYQPAGSVTGRWSSNGGGALSFPAQVRPAVVADDGWVLVVADVAQLEPRVLAGMSGDRALARAARGADLYQSMVDDGAVAAREHAKLGLLGAMYGATSGESGRMVAELTRRYPAAFGMLEGAARAGEHGEVVRTLLGRGSPARGQAWEGGEVPDPVAEDASSGGVGRRRRAYGRFTRNFVVQGTGAEWALCWIADLRNRLWALGDGSVDERPHLVFFLHDEVVVHAPAALAEEVVVALHAAAGTAAGLLFREVEVDFPLSVAVVSSYADAAK